VARRPPESSRPCCCARPAPASRAAPTRSCATSSPSACSACREISGSTRTCRSTGYRRRGECDAPRRQHTPSSPRRRGPIHTDISIWEAVATSSHKHQRRWLWVPAFAGTTRGRILQMNFDDTPDEAAFRAEARQWVGANAPKQYEAELSKASLGRIRLQNADIVEVGKAWQKRKAEAGWACPQSPTEYGRPGASPTQRVV